MNNKAANSEIVIPANLPDDVIMEEILPRLPVKSLIRFKSVSKYWLSTISSKKFIKTHLKFSSSRLQSLLLYGDFIHKGSCFVSFDECDNVKEIVQLEYNLSSSYSRDRPPGNGGLVSYVIDSSNGLVCLFELYFCFYIWNPATNQCHNVSRPDFDHDDPLHKVLEMGFGYVSSIDDYRIGLLIHDEDLCYVYVYSLRAQKWITMSSLDASNESYDFRAGNRYYEGVVVNDTLYWPPQLPWHGEKNAHIAGFNLINGEMKKFPLTMELIDGYHDEVRVFRLKGCLSLCFYKCVEGDYNSTNSDVDVWKLKHQNDWNSWEKLISFDFGGRDNLLWLFENGKCLLKVKFNQTMPHNENDNDDFSHVALKQYEGITIWPGGSNERFYLENSIEEAWGYAESLVSPFGTNLSDENEHH